MRALVIVLVAILAGPVTALAGERVDLFDTKGRRTGYTIVDRETGRVDFYDAQSRRTGWGRLDQSGKVERFDLKGRRQGGTALPLAPAQREP
ncbi:MAG: hypothetical protein ACREVS_02430 [Burkholderiales bacterium]